MSEPAVECQEDPTWQPISAVGLIGGLIATERHFYRRPDELAAAGGM